MNWNGKPAADSRRYAALGDARHRERGRMDRTEAARPLPGGVGVLRHKFGGTRVSVLRAAVN